MGDADAYVTLVTSLPASERLFVAKQPPLSRVRLERRLSMLSHDDHAVLARIEDVMSWRAYDMDDTELSAMARARALMGDLTSETLREVVAERLDTRSVIAALRMRRRGDPAPVAPDRGRAWLWPTRLAPHIVANWNDPTFQLAPRMPWLKDAVQLLDAQDPLGLERLLLNATFAHLKRHAARHHFDFEAVVIYVLKWNIFDRWARADARAASARFEELTQDALKTFDRQALERVA